MSHDYVETHYIQNHNLHAYGKKDNNKLYINQRTPKCVYY